MKARFLLALSLAFGSVFLALPAQAEPIATVWENSPVGIWLPEGVTFSSVSGWYGSPDDPNCGVDVSGVLTALALGENHFDVVADNSVFGDPCGGVYKVLKITGIDANWQPIEQPSQPTQEPTQEPSAIPTAEPTATPTPEQLLPVSEQTPEPSPSATPEPEPSPSSTPSVDVVDPIVPVLPPVVEPVVTPPVIIPQPQPQPVPFPVVSEPAPEPMPEPLPPTPEPTPEPVATPEPALPPVVAPEPTPEAPQPVVAPPAPPTPVIVVTPAPEPPTPVTTVDPQTLDAKSLTVAEVAQLAAVAVSTLATEPQGSPAYNQALEQLMVVAQADDPEVPTELASIPLLGNAAVAVLDAFNQLGNFGSDISPKVRKQAKKEAIATIAVGTATTASAVAASGSVGYRRKETP